MAGSAAVMLTAKRTAAAAPIPAWLVEAERDEQDVAGEPLHGPGQELHDRRPGAEARLAEDLQAEPDLDHGPAGDCGRLLHALEPRGLAPAQDPRGGEEQPAEQDDRRDCRDDEGVLPPRKTPTVANMTLPRIASASRLSKVCETSVPSTTGKRSRMRPSRRATISAREGSPSLAGRVADISTPIIVPRAVSRRRTRTPGRAAQRIACHASARISMDAHIRAKATRIQTGVAATIASPIDSMPIRLSASIASPAPATTPPPMSTRRATFTAVRRLWTSGCGSSDGRRRGEVRGPGSAGRTPVRSATADSLLAGCRPRPRSRPRRRRRSRPSPAARRSARRARGRPHPSQGGGPVERQLAQGPRRGRRRRPAARGCRPCGRGRPRGSRRCRRRRPASEDANASVRTMPKLSPPSEGATSRSASPRSCHFSSSVTRPATSTPSGSSRSGSTSVSVAPATISRASTPALRSASKERSRIGRPLRLSARPTKSKLSGPSAVRSVGRAAARSTPFGTTR